MNFCEAANRSVFCNGNFDDEYHLPTVTLIMAVIFSLLSVATALENNLILVALRRDRCLHPPSKLLLCNLTITDLCTALISQPVSAAVSLAGRDQIGGERCLLVEYTAFLLTAIFSGLSLSTVTVISVDRLMALLLGIRYKQTITGRRIRVVLFLLWIQSILVGVVVAVGLISLNSVLNPIVYCWKIKEVRKAVKETITQFCACFYG